MGTDKVMVPKTPSERGRDVKQLVNQGLGPLFLWYPVEILRQKFDYIMRRKTEPALEGLRKGMTPGQDPAALCALASDDAYPARVEVLER